jgi:adenylate cyclase
VDGKLVVVGVTAQGVGDLRVTPWGPGFPGVEMRATAIQNLISGDGIARPGWMALVDVAVLLLLAWLAFLILRQAALRRALLGVLALVVAYLVAGFIAFRSAGWWLNLVYPTALMLALALAELMQRYVKVDQQQRMVRHAFRHYLAPKLVDLVCDNAAALRLGGERRELSFIFTDLAGFTSLCEKLPAEGLVQLLRTYFERLIEVIHAHHGLVERIVGDGMVVFFNAPLDQPDHACRALRCALGMDAAAEALRSELIAAGIEMGVTRIGINTGDVSTGNFGSSTRFHYTAMGDPINVAARMETANRYLGTRICAARATLERCAEVAWRPIGRLRVKGRGAVVEAGEPVTAEVAATQQFREYCAAYSALEAGTATALEQFAALAAEHPGDPLAQLHQRRLAAGETGVGVEISAS